LVLTISGGNVSLRGGLSSGLLASTAILFGAHCFAFFKTTHRAVHSVLLVPQ